jgi:hypothetical protein
MITGSKFDQKIPFNVQLDDRWELILSSLMLTRRRGSHGGPIT